MTLGEPWPYTYGQITPLALSFVSRWDVDVLNGNFETALSMARELVLLKAENEHLQNENAELKARLGIEE